MTGKLSAEALMDIEDYARAAHTGGTLDRKPQQIGRLANHNAALLGHIDALQAENEALEAEIKALRAEIVWPTFREAVEATGLGENIAKTMLRMCQEAVAKREASA